MNEWQNLRQLKYLLRIQQWETSGEVVFGAAVRVNAGPNEAPQGVLRYPMALLRPLPATSDTEEPDMIEQDTAMRLLVRVGGDEMGEHAIMGGPRSSGSTSSKGRGLLEVEEEALNAIKKISEIDGIGILNFLRSIADSTQDEEEGYVNFRDYIFTTKVTATRYYHPCTNFTAVDATGGGRYPCMAGSSGQV